MSDKKDDTGSGRSAHTLGSDEMFTYHRVVERVQGANTSPEIEFRHALALRFTKIGIILQDDGWPPLMNRVEVSQEDDSVWFALSEEDEARTWEIWPELRVECDVPEPEWWGRGLKAELGLNFTCKRTRRGTQAYWLAAEANVIRTILDAETEQAALWDAARLGELRTEARFHGLHLPAITTGRKQRRVLDQHRSKAITSSRASAAERRDAIRTMLPQTKLTGKALSEYLIRRLKDEYGIDISERSIRRDLPAIRAESLD
ncbi:hypothetical protein [Jannaschia seohaensis]|uniref:hypothetical protein n=1 Tax=Jannaschia seohaensis TaxID=475081 RepID=UPI000D6BD0F4|nr:hypothetical protein [Jannaschia seohaensis]